MKTVIEMAREAEIGDGHSHIIRRELPNLERFAELVRAEAIAAEREACANVCEQGEFMTFGCAAAAIRARSNT